MVVVIRKLAIAENQISKVDKTVGNLSRSRRMVEGFKYKRKIKDSENPIIYM